MTDRNMGKALHIVPSQFHTIETLSHAHLNLFTTNFAVVH